MFIKVLAAVVAISSLSVTTLAAESPDMKLSLPTSGVLKAAFIISDNATLIDIAGPMQTFDQVQAPGHSGIETFTVSRSKAPLKAGTLTVVPDFTFADAPDPDIVVLGAQSGNDEDYLGYIRKMNARGKLMLSICTGVSKFAQAGILDGKDATSHHDFIADFQKRFPNVHFVNNKAWVHSAPTIFTAGGETSGIELALHIVELYWDHDVAVKTARYMEYRGPDWQK